MMWPFTRSTWSFCSSRFFMSSISSLSMLRASNRLLRRSCGEKNGQKEVASFIIQCTDVKCLSRSRHSTEC